MSIIDNHASIAQALKALDAHGQAANALATGTFRVELWKAQEDVFMISWFSPQWKTGKLYERASNDLA